MNQSPATKALLICVAILFFCLGVFVDAGMNPPSRTPASDAGLAKAQVTAQPDEGEGDQKLRASVDQLNATLARLEAKLRKAGWLRDQPEEH